MIHVGDITKLDGHTLPIVDVITGGSPCQDLSVAGKRAGLDGERSGLFMEQIRIVKEMREHDRLENGRPGYLCRPRFMVWENVPGAFSSNGGKDFQAVLTEIARIADEESPDVPLPEKGRWPKAGCIYDDLGRWSIAFRVHDAQYWGVPQRRKRIALVADFGGLSAPEILFERKGLSGYTPEGFRSWQGTARTAEEGSDPSGTVCLNDQDGMAVVTRPVYTTSKNSYHTEVEEDVANTLVATDYKDPPTISEYPYYIVRRLTPLECERLQGFPDGWTDIGDWVDSKGKTHKAADSPRYKALGNSIALPFWQYLARRICAQYERDITMGSLFDGIGGFPLVFERCGAKAVWASEIEEFPIAVTKKHFPERGEVNDPGTNKDA